MILITGSTGLIGSHLLLDLLLKGEKVRALKRAGSDLSPVKKVFAAHPDLFNVIEWAEGNVLDIFSLQQVVQGINKVYHCAAIVSFDPADADLMMHTNVQGTANVVNCCLENKVEKLCHVSSIAAINRINESEVIDENSEWKNSKENSNYAISKYSSEREVWRGIAEGLKAVIVNPPIVIGPGNWKTGSTAMFMQVWKGLKFYTEGTSGFVDVRDVTKAMIRLMDSEITNERFIVSGENVSFRQVFDWIAEDFGRKKPFIYANAFLRNVAWRSEAAKKMVFGTRPFITRETAISAGKKIELSNKKIIAATGIEFSSIKNAVKRTSEIFMSEVKQT